ncbi:cupin-like domain-containing protein [Sphingopyxis indica]|uniref:cupin-like domain-containing protein n=1 Tax=Sphingopyxis indica TaxID=436663 RepID=UPI0029391EBC|nr:cupin-like domain-containing protein [Sphingopyxis indica]WOF42003.1 cupin-like domain-containing protein [Sphingopyxis indica]
MTPLDSLDAAERDRFERDYRAAGRPVVIRGIVADWPIVALGRRDWRAALNAIAARDSGAPADIMIAPASEKGRFFYGPDLRGFNFQRDKGPLARLARHLIEIADQADPVAIYAGAAALDAHLPGFAAEHRFPLLGDDAVVTARIWLGNATRVATHFDLSDNFAAVALGRRRFTLFPPDATPDLYVGPLNHTLAGQPVSMVDPLAPDHDRYPRYARAEAQALTAELEPGDAIYIPTLWWHHVEATEPANILINYWHNDVARGGGFTALIHALLSIRDLPAAQREGWRAWFDHFVFGDEAGEAAAHLPPSAQGVAGPASAERDEMIRRYLLTVLSSS